MIANEERGEIDIELEGVPHVLRPSFEAQVAIEKQTGRSIEQLAAAAGNSAMSIEHMAVVVTECVKAHARATGDATRQGYSAQRVGECIVEAGKLIVGKRVELLLFLAATGGYTASGEVRALPKKPAAGSAGTVA